METAGLFLDLARYDGTCSAKVLRVAGAKGWLYVSAVLRVSVIRVASYEIHLYVKLC